jgi:hypothetical protein
MSDFSVWTKEGGGVGGESWAQALQRRNVTFGEYRGGRSALEHVVLVFEACVYPGRGNGVDGMTGETRVSM